MKYIVTCVKEDGVRVERILFSEFQVFTVVNQLHRDGCINFIVEEMEE
jgi:hypothetical protein